MGARLVAAKARVAAKGKTKSKATTVRGMRAAAKYKDELHPRDQSGRFADKPGAGDDAPRKARAAKTRKPFGRLPPEIARANSRGEVVDGKVHAFATAFERRLARAIGIKHIGDHKPTDISGEIGGRYHNIECKTIPMAKKQSLTMHADARLRKVDHYRANPDEIYHTVAFDGRAQFGGGQYKSRYSGHDIYYKRGADAYSLSKMYKVKDLDELARLIRMKDSELPEAARGSLALDAAAYAHLQKVAATATESRNRRNVKRKAMIRDEARKAREQG